MRLGGSILLQTEPRKKRHKRLRGLRNLFAAARSGAARITLRSMAPSSHRLSSRLSPSRQAQKAPDRRADRLAAIAGGVRIEQPRRNQQINNFLGVDFDRNRKLAGGLTLPVSPLAIGGRAHRRRFRGFRFAAGGFGFGLSARAKASSGDGSKRLNPAAANRSTNARTSSFQPSRVTWSLDMAILPWVCW